MDNQTRVQMRQILEGDAPLTQYQFVQLLQGICKVLTSNEGMEGGSMLGLLTTPISKQIQYDLDFAVAKVQGIGATILTLNSKIDDELDAAYDAVNVKVNEYTQKFNALQSKLANASFRLPSIDLPYNWKDLLEMTERFGNMTEEQQAAFLTLAEAFKKS